jgi:hypothetical protein
VQDRQYHLTQGEVPPHIKVREIPNRDMFSVEDIADDFQECLTAFLCLVLIPLAFFFPVLPHVPKLSTQWLLAAAGT